MTHRSRSKESMLEMTWTERTIVPRSPCQEDRRTTHEIILLDHTWIHITPSWMVIVDDYYHLRHCRQASPAQFVMRKREYVTDVPQTQVSDLVQFPRLSRSSLGLWRPNLGSSCKSDTQNENYSGLTLLMGDADHMSLLSRWHHGVSKGFGCRPRRASRLCRRLM